MRQSLARNGTSPCDSGRGEGCRSSQTETPARRRPAAKLVILALSALLVAATATAQVRRPTERRISGEPFDFKQYITTTSDLWGVSKTVLVPHADLPSVVGTDTKIDSFTMSATMFAYKSISNNYGFELRNGNYVTEGWLIVGNYYDIRWLREYGCEIDPATGTMLCRNAEAIFTQVRLQRIELSDEGWPEFTFTCDHCTVNVTPDFPGWD